MLGQIVLTFLAIAFLGLAGPVKADENQFEGKVVEVYRSPG